MNYSQRKEAEDVLTHRGGGMVREDLCSCCLFELWQAVFRGTRQLQKQRFCWFIVIMVGKACLWSSLSPFFSFCSAQDSAADPHSGRVFPPH